VFILCNLLVTCKPVAWHLSLYLAGGRSLRPVKNRGEEGCKSKLLSSIFYFPFIFHWANYTLNKTLPLFLLFPYFLLFSYFSISIFNKKLSLYFLIPLFLLSNLFFIFSLFLICTINRNPHYFCFSPIFYLQTTPSTKLSP